MTGQTRTEPVLILGGGIAGFATALSLAKVGVASTVLEQAEAFKEIGAGIQVGPNGLRALGVLGMAEAAMALAVRPEELVLMNSVTAEPITVIPTGEDFQARFGHPYSLVHRADLHGVLLRAAEAEPLITLRTGVKITQIQEGPSIAVHSETGEVIRGAALIGADGLWSRTRQLIVGDGPPLVSGHIAYRAVLPAADIPEAYRRNAMILWAGPKNHLVQYPLRGGEAFNLVAVFHSDKYVEGWDTTGDVEELYKRFGGTCDVVRDLLGRIDAWRMWVLCDREPVANWSRGNITLVGDAAHPMLQYLAQGASMALEDAVILGQEIAHTPGDYATAFTAYQARRYLRTGRCQIMARLYGEAYHADGVKAELRNGMLQGRTAEQSHDSLAWLYDETFT